MGYMNTFESMGVKQFCKEASNKGVDGILIVDMPPEESNEFSKDTKSNGIDVIRLIAPTTDLSRAKKFVISLLVISIIFLLKALQGQMI